MHNTEENWQSLKFRHDRLCPKKHVTNYSAHYESQDHQKQMVEELPVKGIRMHDERCVINALCVSHICEKVHEH
ncbi:hypothetical protein T11_13510, partial [Trichinella zimbabwensis]